MKKIIYLMIFICISDGNTSNLIEENAETINRNQKLEIQQINIALKEIRTIITPEIKSSLELFDKYFENQNLNVHELCEKLNDEKKKLLNCIENCSTPLIYTILVNPQTIHQQFLLDQENFRTFKVTILNFIHNIYTNFFSPDYVMNSLMPVNQRMIKSEVYKIEMLSIYVDCLIVNIRFYKKALKKEVNQKLVPN